MNRLSVTPFNEYVVIDQFSTSTTVYTSLKHAPTLGMFDQIAYQVSVQQARTSANPSITVLLAHSADGKNWLPKPGTPIINNHPIDPATSNPLLGFDDGTTPSLRFVRFEITLTVVGSGPVSASVRIDATLNDVREGDFAYSMRRKIEKEEEAWATTTCYPGGTPVDPSMFGVNMLFNTDDQGYTVGEQIGGLQISNPTEPTSESRTEFPVYATWEVPPGSELCVGTEGTLTVSTTSGSTVISPSSGGSSGSESC
jgi:hypothetical protein